ncbi:MAG TPA: hypothetical protein VF190_02135, partial [Rhodothermales bacterium]
MRFAPAFVLTAIAVLPLAASAQPARPIPYPVDPPNFFKAAVAAGTRTNTGEPGAAYWQNEAAYEIEATLRPSEHRLEGRQTVRYRNQSPDPLDFLIVHLRQNIQRADALRNIPTGETTEGMEILSVRVGDVTLKDTPPGPGAGYLIQGTLMQVRLPETLQPGGEVEVQFEWQFTVAEGSPRMGRDDNSYFLGYWYPQITVYDDLRGWDGEPNL